MNPPVHVSGIGVMSPLGHDLLAFDAALFAGHSGVGPFSIELPGVDAATVAVARCAVDVCTVRTLSRLPADRGTALALLAVEAALQHAGWASGGVDPTRLGVYWGSGMGGAHSFDAACQTLHGEHRRMRPTTVVTSMPNAALAEIALRVGARGAAIGYACACASSAVAIGEALRALRAGWIDVAIAGGSEALLTPAIVASWHAMRVLAPGDGAVPQAACRPFAADRAGFALGEGAAALVLETAAHAQARRPAQAPSPLVLSGYATNCDGLHITHPDAAGQARAMRAALADAGLQPHDIGHLNAHGTATQAGDAAEAQSIADVFCAHGVPVTATKALHGHLLGAGGAVELVAVLRALNACRLPPSGCVPADPAFGVDLVTGAARPAPALRHALSNSFAFGGTNAVLIASRLGD